MNASPRPNALVTEYFPMDLYRSMFFINTLDHEYNRTQMCYSFDRLGALDKFDVLARKLYGTTLSEESVAKIKYEMSRNLNLMMANRNETLAEATRLYETVLSLTDLIDIQADQAFNTLDKSITASEENLLAPPSETYFLPSPEPGNDDDTDSSDLSSDVDESAEVQSVKTEDLTPAHLRESELKALRRRMKKSYQWIPTPACIKRELQLNGRWPLRDIDRTDRRKRKRATTKHESRRKAQKKRDSVPVTQKTQVEKNRLKKKQDPKFTIPISMDEPTYCYCGDVSYGEMIACENEVSFLHNDIDESFVLENGFIWSVQS